MEKKFKGHVTNQHKFSTPYPIHYFLGATDSIHYFSGATTQIHHNAPPHDPDYHFWTATDPNGYFFAPPYPIHLWSSSRFSAGELPISRRRCSAFARRPPTRAALDAAAPLRACSQGCRPPIPPARGPRNGQMAELSRAHCHIRCRAAPAAAVGLLVNLTRRPRLIHETAD